MPIIGNFIINPAILKKHISIILIAFICGSACIPAKCYGQSPELSLREFASGQIKKGVRSIGMGGDGATWGNYALVWADTNTALVDAGISNYTNSNSFSFTAVGVNTPNLWRGLAVYAIALSQYAGDIATSLRSPGLGSSATNVHGDGNNQAVFVKAAMPMGKGFSAGVLLSYERSQFNAVADNNTGDYVRYQTGWLPSGGLGVTWQPVKRLLVGVRALFNNDMERRADKKGTTEGLNAVSEYRLGASVGLWKGALIDLGGNARFRANKIYNTSHTDIQPNVGFEQNLYDRHFAFRAGIDESSAAGGISVRFRPVIIDVAWVNNLGKVRLGDLFGSSSNSLIATFIFNYGVLKK